MTNFAKTFTYMAILVSSLAHSQAYSPDNKLNNLDIDEIQINKPEAQDSDHKSMVQFACYGCLSTETYRPRNEYVRPHVRSNGTYVDGYWRS